jgi:hypothetical protein
MFHNRVPLFEGIIIDKIFASGILARLNTLASNVTPGHWLS